VSAPLDIEKSPLHTARIKKREENVITGRERETLEMRRAEAIYQIRAGRNLITEGKLKLYSQPGLLKATTARSPYVCFIITAKSANIYNTNAEHACMSFSNAVTLDWLPLCAFLRTPPQLAAFQ
jgi:hypothetical protein